MKYTEQAVETLDDAGSVIANKNIEIDTLRQRVAELEIDCDEYHQVALNHIHANENLTAERDALKQQRDELLAVLAGLVGCIDCGSENPTLKLDAARAAIASVKEK